MPHHPCTTPPLQSGTKWTVKLNDVQERQSFTTDCLHATAPPPPDFELTAFEPKVLDSGLPITNISGYISDLELDPEQPVELRRLHPESGTMLDLMTTALRPSELDDDLLRRLHYKATGVQGVVNWIALMQLDGWLASHCVLSIAHQPAGCQLAALLTPTAPP